VLFDKTAWAGLRDGSITVTFRHWKRRQAKPGGRYRTAAGVLEVDAVAIVDRNDITDGDARRAGHADRAALFRYLDRHPDGDLYRVDFHHVGEDPRADLRQRADLDDDEWSAIVARLRRLDAASPRGAWTTATLDVIAARPATRAGDLAESLGRDRASFKVDVRKLKEMGLTESLEVGYRLSPRGEAVRTRLASPGEGPSGA
jgi:hypothetical protein